MSIFWPPAAGTDDTLDIVIVVSGWKEHQLTTPSIEHCTLNVDGSVGMKLVSVKSALSPVPPVAGLVTELLHGAIRENCV